MIVPSQEHWNKIHKALAALLLYVAHDVLIAVLRAIVASSLHTAAPTLNQLAEQSRSNSERWFPHLHDPHITSPNELLKHFTLGLTEEAGEVAGVVKKMTGYRKGQADHSSPLNLAHELVDVLTYLLHIAAHEGIDIDAAVAEKTVLGNF
jgi:hypothetical protein